ncbi:pseudouridine synthase [Wenjunlia vitaminophila]|uniref:RNA pseudouridylate synthase n=1 Tax=Wenjunlia vitaminophila TaxID=76728 RepID=A0A0T6LUH5_WENVI|nr:RNA pseudouridine synthase [Wenjunlia vitaminophila]KRV49739.1 pseudouridine synthase [Wenjunlia vitaminophila]
MHQWTKIRQEAACFEDEAVLVLNKPAGISVMGERHETDLVTLAREAGEELFPVHRIDKVTSGAILFAKDMRFHPDLTRQFSRRTVDKAYLAITRPGGLPARGTIELPLSVGRKNRVRIAAQRTAIETTRTPLPGQDGVPGAEHGRWSVPPGEVFTEVRTYPSETTFTRAWQDPRNAVLVVEPVTGRRHQIRVHLAWIGHPIEGDPLFDKGSAARGERTALHSWRLAFDAAWTGGTRVTVEAEPGSDFWSPVHDRLPDGGPAAVLRTAAASPSAPRDRHQRP